MSAKQMVIDGVAYIEKKPPFINVNQQVCHMCAFGFDLRKCGTAIDGEAEKAFGGDCFKRDVIYEVAT